MPESSWRIKMAHRLNDDDVERGLELLGQLASHLSETGESPVTESNKNPVVRKLDLTVALAADRKDTDTRLKRLEYAAIIGAVAVASPKVGGPAPHQVVTAMFDAAINLMGAFPL